MADFNLILGNGNGCVLELNQAQIDNTIYTGEYVANLAADAGSSEVGRRAETAHSQGVYANTAESRVRIENSIKRHITKIAGVFTYGKRFYTNETLTQSQALTYLTDGDIAGLLAHPDTLEMNEVNGAKPFFDAMIGGTDT
jgi:hypothetical protein